jgi:hypothetical protein
VKEMSGGFITFGEIVSLVLTAILARTGLGLVASGIKNIGKLLQGLGLLGAGAAIGFESFDDIRKRLNGTADAVEDLNKKTKTLGENNAFEKMFLDVQKLKDALREQADQQIRQIQNETALIGLSDKEKDLQKAITDLKEKGLAIEQKLKDLSKNISSEISKNSSDKDNREDLSAVDFTKLFNEAQNYYKLAKNWKILKCEPKSGFICTKH